LLPHKDNTMNKLKNFFRPRWIYKATDNAISILQASTLLISICAFTGALGLAQLYSGNECLSFTSPASLAMSIGGVVVGFALVMLFAAMVYESREKIE